MDLEQVIEKMSPEEQKKFLNLELPEELEKEAAAEVAEADFQNALYAYGALTADVEIESEEAGEAGLSKEASENFSAAEAEIAEAIENGYSELGLDEVESDEELHKTAMAAAALIFEGYCDQMEKVAKGKVKGFMGAMKKHMGRAAEKAKALGSAAMKHGKKGVALVKKHPGKAGLIAAGTAAAGYGAHRMMKKKADELTAAELVDMALEKQATLDVIADGVEKLAAHGKGKGGMIAKGLKHLKAHGKKHGKMYGAGAAGGVAGYLAGRMHKKHE